MNYLVNYGYTEIEIAELVENIPVKLLEVMVSQKKVVCVNLTYLEKYNLPNLKEIFNKFYDIFLMDPSSFKAIFEKYEKEDLVKKISKNIDIIDYL